MCCRSVRRLLCRRRPAPQRQVRSRRGNWRPDWVTRRVFGVPEVSPGEAAPCHAGWLHGRATLFLSLCAISWQCGDYPTAAADDSDRSAPHRAVPRKRPSCQYAGISRSVRLQGRRSDGEAIRQAVPNLVTARTDVSQGDRSAFRGLTKLLVETYRRKRR